jgi:hypothetical protein
MRKKTVKSIRKKTYENVKGNSKADLNAEVKRLKKLYKSVRGEI